MGPFFSAQHKYVTITEQNNKQSSCGTLFFLYRSATVSGPTKCPLICHICHIFYLSQGNSGHFLDVLCDRSDCTRRPKFLIIVVSRPFATFLVFVSRLFDALPPSAPLNSSSLRPFSRAAGAH